MEEGRLGKWAQSTRFNQTCLVSCRKTITALAFSPDGKYLVTGEVSEEQGSNIVAYGRPALNQSHSPVSSEAAATLASWIDTLVSAVSK